MNNKIHDNQFRNLLSGTKLQASENLKFRIMQQIETEKTLSKQKTNKYDSSFRNTMSILGVMYSLIAILGITVYYSDGANALLSTSFYIPLVFIASVCSVFLLISTFDDKRRSKHKK